MATYLCHCSNEHPYRSDVIAPGLVKIVGQFVWGACRERIRRVEGGPVTVGSHNSMGCPDRYCAWCGDQAPNATPIIEED